MKKFRSAFIVFAVLTIFSANFSTLFADENPIEIPWIPDFPAIGKQLPCQQNLSNGFTRGSVKWVCVTQWVCPECTCTPEACGEVSVVH